MARSNRTSFGLSAASDAKRPITGHVMMSLSFSFRWLHAFCSRMAASGPTAVATFAASIALAGVVEAASPWSRAADLQVSRGSHTATLLSEGRVLLTGGDSNGTAELYDPIAKTWALTGSMSTARQSHTASLLADGTVLVTGGYFDLQGAELYDPATGLWSKVSSMHVPRVNHTASLLPDGRVLVAGGYDGVDDASESAEIFDPDTGLWTETGSLVHARQAHTSTVLSNGKILVVGGSSDGFVVLKSAEIYDPELGEWSGIASMVAPRILHTATLLADGRVLVAGGVGDDYFQWSAEIFDPSTGRWSAAASPLSSRAGHTATPVGTRVLIAGGQVTTELSSTEVYDPANDQWTRAGDMTIAHAWHTATGLNDGDVIVAGGNSPRSDHFDIDYFLAPHVVGTGKDASCTEAELDEALTYGGTVTFDCGATPTSIPVTSPKLISSNTTIDGDNMVTLDAAAGSPVLFVERPGVELTVRGLAIVHARAGILAGAAIWNGKGRLTVDRCLFAYNESFVPGEPEVYGGAIYDNGGEVLINNSTFIGNTAPFGGAIFHFGSLTVANSTFVGNSASSGSAIYGAGPLTVTNCTFVGNDAPTSGAISFGGGVGNRGSLLVTNSTFAANIGTAISNRSTAAVRNTILATSTSGANCKGTVPLDGGHNLDDGDTCGLSGDLCGSGVGGTSTCNAAAMLDPAGLRDNGGPTETIALCTGNDRPSIGCAGVSPAVGGGDPAVCTEEGVGFVNSRDQRGWSRPGHGYDVCSIGAFEASLVVCGDANRNGRLAASDALSILKAAVGGAQCTESFCLCDVNTDSSVTAIDALLTLRAAIGAQTLECAC